MPVPRAMRVAQRACGLLNRVMSVRRTPSASHRECATPGETRKAVHQAIGCVLALALVGAAALAISRRPAGADELRLPIAELRSQSAELELLRAQSAAASPRFAQVHAQHLAKAIDASRDELNAMQVEPALGEVRTAASALASQLAAAAHGAADQAAPTAALKALERSLQR